MIWGRDDGDVTDVDDEADGNVDEDEDEEVEVEGVVVVLGWAKRRAAKDDGAEEGCWLRPESVVPEEDEANLAYKPPLPLPLPPLVLLLPPPLLLVEVALVPFLFRLDDVDEGKRVGFSERSGDGVVKIVK